MGGSPSPLPGTGPSPPSSGPAAAGAGFLASLIAAGPCDWLRGSDPARAPGWADKRGLSRGLPGIPGAGTRDRWPQHDGQSGRGAGPQPARQAQARRRGRRPRRPATASAAPRGWGQVQLRAHPSPLHRLRHPGDPGLEQGAAVAPSGRPGLSARRAPAGGPLRTQSRRGGRRGHGAAGRQRHPRLLHPAHLPRGALRPPERPPAAPGPGPRAAGQQPDGQLR